MNAGEIHVKASHVTRDATFEIKVRVVRDWRFRLGCWVLSLGVWILGAVPKIEDAAE